MDSDQSSVNSEEDYDPIDAVKSLLIDCISGIQIQGSFATFGSFPNYVHPGINVDEVGSIRLPLSSDDAESLIRASRQAPFGKGNQTLVDEKVRKTWEIDGSKVSFSNNAWSSWLEDIVRKASEELGVAGGPQRVRAELYKMLLYEKGAMFKTHQDTQKAPGMFGTLVICLPSEHVGGAVRLKHGMEEKKFDTAPLSAFNITYIAWYADVPHEIELVTSGYRWVLTYNLVSSSPITASASMLDMQSDRFREPLGKWRQLDPMPKFLCYVLSHQYTEAGLKLGCLKGEDFHRARYVAGACGKAGDFYVLLASMERIVTFSNDEGGDDYKQSELLIQVVDMDGSALARLKVSENSLVQEIYDNRNPDVQQGGEYMGNQHAEFEQVYNDTGLLIVPKVSATRFLLGHPHELDQFRAFLQRLMKIFQQNQDQHIREFIIQTCEDHLSLKYRDAQSRDGFLGQVAVGAIFLADVDLFKRALRLVRDGFDKQSFLDVGNLISFQTPVVSEDDLAKAFSTIPKLYKIWQCLEQFRRGFSAREVNSSDGGQMQYLSTWVRVRVSEALKSCSQANPEDSGALIAIGMEYDDEMFEEGIKSYIARFIGDSKFVNALAVETLSFSQCSSADKDIVALFLPLFLDAAVSHFKLEMYSSKDKFACHKDDYPYSSWSDCQSSDKRGERDASVIVDLHQHLLRVDKEKASELLRQIQAQTEHLAESELNRLIVALLKQMMGIINQCPLDACQFYQSMMATYVTRAVKPEPKKPGDWSRPEEISDCPQENCSICLPVKEFMLNPAEQTRRLDLSDDDSSHIRLRLSWRCDKSWDMSRKPPVFVISKTLIAWESEHSAWKGRAEQAQKHFKLLVPQGDLKRCLGDKYDAIVGLGMVKVPDEVRDLTAQNTNSADESSKKYPDGQIIPQKRPRSDA